MRALAWTLAPLAFIALWSSSFVAAKIGLVDFSPLLFVALRLLLAAALLSAIARARGQSFGDLRGRWLHLAIAGALLNGLTLGAFHAGMVTVNAAVMALMQALSPMLIALLGTALLDETISRRQWLGIALGTLGVALVLGPRAAIGDGQLTGIGLGAIGVVGLAGGTLYFGRHGRGLPLFPATAVQVGAGGLAVLAAMVFIETPRAQVSAQGLMSIGWNVLAVSIGGMLLYYAMLERGAAGRVAANFYLVPGTASLLAWVILGESLSPLAVFGIALASLGVLLVARAAPGATHSG